MKPQYRELIISAFNSFISAFLLAILAMPIDFDNINKATVIALVYT